MHASVNRFVNLSHHIGYRENYRSRLFPGNLVTCPFDHNVPALGQLGQPLFMASNHRLSTLRKFRRGKLAFKLVVLPLAALARG